MAKKKIFFWLVVILILISVGVYYAKSKKNKIEYTTVKAEKQNLTQTVSVSGKVASQNEINLAFQTTGKLSAIFVNVGDAVKSGQLLAQIDTSTLLHDLDGARADLESQKQTLDSMKKRKSIYDLEQRDAQRAIIDKYQTVVESILKEIDETKIYAPIDSIVERRNFDVGETEIAGSAVLTLIQGNDLEITANVPESDIIKVKLNQEAVLTLDAFSAEDKLGARVSEIEPASTVIQDVVYYKIKLSLDNQDVRLKDGMSVDIDIRTAEKKDVITIPQRAIEINGTDKLVQVLRLFNADGTANIEKRKIETGISGDGSLIEVTNGLQEGDSVITFTKNP